MTDPLFSKNTIRYQETPEIRQLEEMLKTFRPIPGTNLPDKVAAAAWNKPTTPPIIQEPHTVVRSIERSTVVRWSMALLAVVAIALLIAFTNLGQSLAESISRFFKVSIVNVVTEVVSSTPQPTTSSNYPYDQYTLSIEQAEAQAGFEIKSIATLPNADWVFHGAKILPEVQGVTLFYSLPDKTLSSNRVEMIYLYITEQKGEFENHDWMGECPDGSIQNIEVNQWPAELADGTTWQTETEPTPGVKRTWICQIVDPGTTMTLRWAETDLNYEISIFQMGLSGEGADMTLPWLSQQDLIYLAENLK